MPIILNDFAKRSKKAPRNCIPYVSLRDALTNFLIDQIPLQDVFLKEARISLSRHFHVFMLTDFFPCLCKQRAKIVHNATIEAQNEYTAKVVLYPKASVSRPPTTGPMKEPANVAVMNIPEMNP